MIVIPIDKTDIPFNFEMEIAGEDFEFGIRYNERFDFFTVDLFKDGETVALGEKIIYGRALFASYPDEAKLPKCPIIPLSEGNNENRVTYENFGVSTFLFIGDPNE